MRSQRRAWLRPGFVWALLSACETSGPSETVTSRAPAPDVGDGEDSAAPPEVPAKPVVSPHKHRVWSQSPFLEYDHYSYGATFRRAPRHGEKNDETLGEIVLANGHDHTPQSLTFSPVRETDGGPGLPDGGFRYIWRDRPRHYADVVAAELSGERNGQRDELVVASLADSSADPRTGALHVLQEVGGRLSAREIHGGKLSPLSLAVGDVDDDGDPDIVVGSLYLADRAAKLIAVDFPGRDYEAETPLQEPQEPQESPKLSATALTEALATWRTSSYLDEPLSPRLRTISDVLRSLEDTASHGSPVKPIPKQKIEPVVFQVGGEARSVGHYISTGAPSPIVIYQNDDGQFTRRYKLHAPLAFDLELGDLDGDGSLDLMIAGDQLAVIAGPLIRSGKDVKLRGRVLDDGDPRLVAMDIDHAFVGEGAQRHAIVAAAFGCKVFGQCLAIDAASKVQIWRRPLADGLSDAQQRGDIELEGIESAVRFAHLDKDGTVDLLVGRTLENFLDPKGKCACKDDAKPCDEYRCVDCRTRGQRYLSVCVGAPVMEVYGTLVDGEWQDSGDHHGLRRDLTPMSHRIVPLATDPPDAPPSEPVQPVRCVRAGWTTVSYPGPGIVRAASNGVQRFLPAVHGDRHVSVNCPAKDHEITFELWRRESYIVTSTSPLPAPTGPSIVLYRQE